MVRTLHIVNNTQHSAYVPVQVWHGSASTWYAENESGNEYIEIDVILVAKNELAYYLGEY